MPRIITKIDKEGLTTKLTLIIVGLTAGSGLLIPATYASFHPVTTGEIADNTILSADIRNSEVRLADIATDAVTSGKISNTNGVYSVDIADGQVTTADIANDAIRPDIQIKTAFVAVNPNNWDRVAVDCPAGTVVSGGGYYATDVNLDVYSNLPEDGDTWEVRGFNNGPSVAYLHAYGLCMGPMP